MYAHLQGSNNLLSTYFSTHATLVLITDHHHATILLTCAKSSRSHTETRELRVAYTNQSYMVVSVQVTKYFLFKKVYPMARFYLR